MYSNYIVDFIKILSSLSISLLNINYKMYNKAMCHTRFFYLKLQNEIKSLQKIVENFIIMKLKVVPLAYTFSLGSTFCHLLST